MTDLKVEAFFQKQTKWVKELEKLHQIMLSCELEEIIKWGSPVYTFNGNNIVGIRGFKQHCALWFFKGALLKDTQKILISSSEETQSMRQIRFTSLAEIVEIEKHIKTYIWEAIEVEKLGFKVEKRTNQELIIPKELQQKLTEIDTLRLSFSKLTPGRQREYANYVAEAKQNVTRMKRADKIIPKILEGRGLNDKYRKC